MSSDSEEKIKIVDLPPELLAHIFEYLAPEEISKLSKLCQVFNSASQIDSIWQKKCSELPIPKFTIQNDELSFRQIYTKVLHKYWKLLGFWKRNVKHYGGLLHVSFDSSSWKIVGKELNPPKYPNLQCPMSGSLMFSIVPDSVSDDNVICDPSDTEEAEQHYCAITLVETNSEGKLSEFHTECQAPTLHDGRALEVDINQLIHTLNDVNDADHQMMMLRMMLRKSTRLYDCRHKNQFSRMEWPLPVQGAIIQPGLFKGDYSSHGVELIMLTYVDEHNVNAIKVTGDPNIPADKITFRANLLEAFVMNLEQQVSITSLMEAESLCPSVPPSQLPQQPFRVPDQFLVRQAGTPNVCKARFNGSGQIASEGYRNSSFIPGHWIIFNEDLFGFMWFNIRAFSLFHRVEEKF